VFHKKAKTVRVLAIWQGLALIIFVLFRCPTFLFYVHSL